MHDRWRTYAVMRKSGRRIGRTARRRSEVRSGVRRVTHERNQSSDVEWACRWCLDGSAVVVPWLGDAPRCAGAYADRSVGPCLSSEFESEEERLTYQAMRRSVELYEAQGKRERVLGQLHGLKGRDARKKRVRKVAKPTWREPFDDDPWYHGVQ
jgi:hypothetical protein